MRREKLRGLTLDIHDSIDEMGILRFQTYNRCLLIDAEIGSDADALNRHYSKLSLLAKHKRYDELVTELSNYHQSLLMIISGTNIEMQTFVSLVESINGRKQEDFTPEGIQNVLKRLDRAGATFGFIKTILEQVKKNFQGSSRRSSQLAGH